MDFNEPIAAAVANSGGQPDEKPIIKAPILCYTDSEGHELPHMPLPKKIRNRRIKAWRAAHSRGPYTHGPNGERGWDDAYRPRIRCKHNRPIIFAALAAQFGAEMPTEPTP